VTGANSRRGGDRTLSLPIEAYMITAAQLDVLNRAGALLVTQCMAAFGFSYQQMPSPAPAQPGQMARRYGIMDAAAASEYGYHPAPGDGIRAKQIQRQPDSVDSGGRLPAAEWRALTGRSGPQDPASAAVAVRAKVNGRLVPAGGCEGQSRRRVHGDDGAAVAEEQGMVDQINDAGFVASKTDPRVRDVITKWSSCMRDEGYSFPDPMAAVGSADLSRAEPSKRELATAVADMACKLRTNLISTWNRAEASYESQQIKKNAVTLDAYRAHFTAQVRQAAALLSAK
jgi:hypothetical protein